MAEELESGCILAMTSDDGGLDRNGKGEVAESPLLLRRTTEDGTAYGSISTKGTFAAVTDAEEDNDEDVADGDDNGHGEDGLCRLGWLMDIPNIVVILSISSIFAVSNDSRCVCSIHLLGEATQACMPGRFRNTNRFKP